MRISQLEGKRVALWGWGREGRAAFGVLQQRLPSLPLTLFCPEAEAAAAREETQGALTVRSDVTGAALAAFEVVIKSPGISPYGEAALQASAQGTQFIGGTSLWFAEQAAADGIVHDTVCVTGTKGKSTTTALLAHLLRASGERTGLIGNIGLPLLEVLDPQPVPKYWAVELSSYQTGEVARSGAHPQVAIVLNLFPEHLDWHGSQARYIQDKLRLVTEAAPRIAVLNAADPYLAGLSLPKSEIVWFNQPLGWHMRGDVVHRGEQPVFDTAHTPLPGRHNRGNLCAVLAAIEALGLDAVALAPAVQDFRPLPNRLQTLGTREGITFVNDSISTTPHMAHDVPPVEIVTMGANGPRIHALLQPLADAGRFGLHAAADLSEAMQLAQVALGGQGGVVLLSPGAPSYGVYRDYVARGRHFAELAGFDPDAITAIPGIGIA